MRLSFFIVLFWQCCSIITHTLAINSANIMVWPWSSTELVVKGYHSETTNVQWAIKTVLIEILDEFLSVTRNNIIVGVCMHMNKKGTTSDLSQIVVKF